MDLVESNFNITQRHPWELSRSSIVTGLIQRFVKSDRKKQILDVGSGDAYVADGFTRALNAECKCLDIGYTSDSMQKIGALYNNPDLSLYEALSQVSPKKEMDVVTLLDVIEHVPDDAALINEIISSGLVGKETYVLITVPAYQSLFSHHDALLKHYRRYNMKLLRNTTDKCGLEIIYGGYFFMSLIPPRLLQVIKEKLSPKPEEELQHLGNWEKSEWLTKTIQTILLTDYKIGELFRKLRIHIPGLSCFAVCKLKPT